MTISIEELSISLFSDNTESLIAKEFYQKWGCFVAKNLLSTAELQPVRQELTQLINLLRTHSGLSTIHKPTATFDAGFLELITHNPKFSSVLYNASRRLTSVHQLSVSEKLLNLSKNLMETDLIMSNPYKTIRIDCQQREDYLLPWHQDYHYVQDSLDAVIYWIPLHDVDEENGCMMIAPGSHQQGLLPVKMDYPSPCIKDLHLVDPSPASNYSCIRLPVKTGDVVVFNTLLLHKSCPNLTPFPRWTLQIRHGNFKHPFAIQKHWPGSHYEQNWFDRSHPEYVVS